MSRSTIELQHLDGSVLNKLAPQYRPENQPEVPLEKDTCINFQLWTFRAVFRPIFITVVLFPIQEGENGPKGGPKSGPKIGRKTDPKWHLKRIHA